MAAKFDPLKYAKNAVKSVGFIAVGTISGVDKNLTDMVTGSARYAKDAVSYVRDFKNARVSEIKDSGAIDLGKEMAGNFLTDIKTGNWYNSERKEENDKKFAKEMGFDLDFDLGLDEDDDQEEDSNITSKSLNAVGKNIANTSAKASFAGSSYVAKTSKTNTKALITHQTKMFGAINNSLMLINSSILNLHKDLASPLNSHIQNSAKFYEASSLELAKQTSYLAHIDEMLSEMYQPSKKSKRASAWAEISSGGKGLPNLSAWGKIAMGRAMDTTKLGDISDTYSSILEALPLIRSTGQLTNSPVATLLTALATSKVKKKWGNSISRVSEGASRFAASIPSRIHRFNKSGLGTGGLGSLLAEILDVFPDYKKGSNRTDKYDKGPTAWSGKDARALQVVIPQILSDILADVRGISKKLGAKSTPKRYYDYERGQFRTKSSMEKDYAEGGQAHVTHVQNNLSAWNDKMIAEMDIESRKATGQILSDRDVDNYTTTFSKLMTICSINNIDLGSCTTAQQALQAITRALPGVFSSGSKKLLDKKQTLKVLNALYSKKLSSSIVDIQAKAIEASNDFNENVSNTSGWQYLHNNESTNNWKVSTTTSKRDRRLRAEAAGQAIDKEGKINTGDTFIDKGLNAISSKFEELMGGDRYQEYIRQGGLFGLIDRLPDKIHESFTKLKDKAKEKIGKWWNESGAKDKWIEAKTSAKNTLTGWGHAITDKASDIYGTVKDAWGNLSHGAYRGGNVVKSGMISVSEGEYVVPSDMNPFYRGRTNRAAQRANERRTAQRYASGSRYWGSYADGGTVAAPANRGYFRDKFLDPIIGDLKAKADQILGSDDAKAKQDYVKQVLGKFDLGKAGIGAIIGGAITGSPLGLIGGLALGGGVGFLTKGEGLSKTLFGEYDPNSKEYKGGKLPQSVTKFIKDKLPKYATAGAIGGILGTITGSPLGMMGGFALGAGMEMLGQTERFQDFLFGHKDVAGDRRGGIVGTIQTRIVDPMINFVEDTISSLKTWLKDKIMAPLTKLGKAVKDWAVGKAKTLGKKAVKGVVKGMKRAGYGVANAVDKATHGAVSAGIGMAKVGLGFAKGVVGAPFWAMGHAGNALQRHNIRAGYSTLTPEERLALMQDQNWNSNYIIDNGMQEYNNFAANASADDLAMAEYYAGGVGAAQKSMNNAHREMQRTLESTIGNRAGNEESYKILRQKMKLAQKNGDYSAVKSYMDELYKGGKIASRASWDQIGSYIDNEQTSRQKMFAEFGKESDFEANKKAFMSKYGLTKLNQGQLNQITLDREALAKKANQQALLPSQASKNAASTAAALGVSEGEGHKINLIEQILGCLRKMAGIGGGEVSTSVNAITGEPITVTGVESTVTTGDADGLHLDVQGRWRDVHGRFAKKPKENNGNNEDYPKYTTTASGTVIKNKMDANGNVVPDLTDANTKEEHTEAENLEAEQTKFYKMFNKSKGGLASLFGGGGKKDDDDGEKKESIFSKIFSAVSSGLSSVTSLLGGLPTLLLAGLGGLIAGQGLKGILSSINKFTEKYIGTESDPNMRKDMTQEEAQAAYDSKSTVGKLGQFADTIQNKITGKNMTAYEKDDYVSQSASGRFATRVIKNGAFGQAFTKTGRGIIKANKSAAKATGKAASKFVTKIGPIITKVFEFAKKVPFLKKAFANVDPAQLGNTISTKLGNSLTKFSKVTNVLGKAAKAAYWINIAYHAIDALQDARAMTILGIIDEPTNGQRVIAMLCETLNEAIPGIGGLIPTETILDIIWSVLTAVNFPAGIAESNLTQQRAKADAELEKYRAETNNPGATLEEYIHNVLNKYTAGQRAKKWVGGAWSSVKSWFSGGTSSSVSASEASAAAISNGTGSGLPTGYVGTGSGIHVSQRGSRRYGSGTLASDGCGPAVASTVLRAYGKNSDINSAADYAEAGRYIAGDSGVRGTRASYFSDILGYNGIKTNYTSNVDSISKSVDSGHPTIILGQNKKNRSKANSPFGPNPHYVVARGTDSRGNVVIDDPELGNTALYRKNILKSAKLGVLTGRGSGAIPDDRIISNNVNGCIKVSDPNDGYRMLKPQENVGNLGNGINFRYDAEFPGYVMCDDNGNPLPNDTTYTINSAYGPTKDEIQIASSQQAAIDARNKTWDQINASNYSNRQKAKNNAARWVATSATEESSSGSQSSYYKNYYATLGAKQSAGIESTSGAGRSAMKVKMDQGAMSITTVGGRTQILKDADDAVWNYLTKDLGMSAAGAAGVMGNLYQESGIKYNILEGLLAKKLKEDEGKTWDHVSYTSAIDDGTINREKFLHPRIPKTKTDGTHYQYGYGLCQWTSPGRKAILYDAAKKANTSIADPAIQLGHLGLELNGDYKPIYNKIKGSTSVKQAAEDFLVGFEGLNEASEKVRRADFAQSYYDRYTNTASNLYRKPIYTYKDIDGASGKNVSYTGTSSGSSVSAGTTSKKKFSLSDIFGVFTSVLGKVASTLGGAAGSVLSWILGTSGNSEESSSENSSSATPDGTGINADASQINYSGMTEQEAGIVRTMAALTGKLNYGQGMGKYPLPRYDFKDGGSSDCSATVSHALHGGIPNLGLSTETDTDGIWTSSYGKRVDTANVMPTSSSSGNGGGSGPNVNKLRPGDALLYKHSNSKTTGHVEMYMGNNLRSGHGGGVGPKITDVTADSDRYMGAVRFTNDYVAGNSGLMPMYDFTRASGRNYVGRASGINTSSDDLMVKIIELITKIAANTTYNQSLPTLIEVVTKYGNILAQLNANGNASETSQQTINAQLSSVMSTLETMATSV